MDIVSDLRKTILGCGAKYSFQEPFTSLKGLTGCDWRILVYEFEGTSSGKSFWVQADGAIAIVGMWFGLLYYVSPSNVVLKLIEDVLNQELVPGHSTPTALSDEILKKHHILCAEHYQCCASVNEVRQALNVLGFETLGKYVVFKKGGYSIVFPIAGEGERVEVLCCGSTRGACRKALQLLAGMLTQRIIDPGWRCVVDLEDPYYGSTMPTNVRRPVRALTIPEDGSM